MSDLSNRYSSRFRAFWLTILLAFLYPLLHALSNNWYAISKQKIAWLFCAFALAALAAYGLARILAAFVLSILNKAGRPSWVALAPGAAIGLVAGVVLSTLMQSTLVQATGSTAGAIAASFACTAAIAALCAQGRAIYVNAFMALLSSMAFADSAIDLINHNWFPSHDASLATGATGFGAPRFKTKPNIYVFIYDAYGSGDVYEKNFAFDNSPQYRELEKRSFKVTHAYSNYFATWPTTLSLFLGEHHYYQLSAGLDDTKIGRSMMAGLAPNPVFDVLWSNGYRIQQIHGIDYFATERGRLDFLFPEEPLYGALRIFDSPVLNAFFGAANIRAGARPLEEQTGVLLSRLQPTPRSGSDPWFTFVHINVPGHSPSNSLWTGLAEFEETFRSRTKQANAHMIRVMDAIIAKDPNAIIAITGDHGAWRYRSAWSRDPDPNKSIEMENVEPSRVARDLFGVMLAVRSSGRCDALQSSSVTPVNLMRMLFACLSGQHELPSNRPADISIAKLGRSLYLVARDGSALAKWESFSPP